MTEQRPSTAVLAIGWAVLAAPILLYGLGTGSLRDWDEATYAQTALEYVERGEWLTATFHEEPWFEKPPLYMWGSALGYRVFGVGELAPRLGAALCGIALVAVTFLFGVRICGRRAGLLAATILLGTPHFLQYSKMGMFDVPLTLFVSLALLGWWESRRRPAWLLLSGAALGIAVMIKSAAIAPAVLAAGLHALVAGRLRVLTTPFFWLGTLLAVCVAAPWHLHQLWVHGSTFVNDYVLFHVVSRVAEPMTGGGPPWFYLSVLVEEQRPWFLLSFVALPYCAFRAWRERDPALLLLVSWVLCVLVPASLTATKYEWYLFPAYPALSLCIAVFLLRVFDPRFHRWVLVVAGVVLAANLALTKRVWDLDYSPDVKRLAPMARSVVAEEQRLCTFRKSPPAARFYTQRRTVRVESLEDPLMRELRSRQTSVACVVPRKHLGELAPTDFQVVAESGELALVTIPSG